MRFVPLNTAAASISAGAILVSDDDPGAPRRTPVRVMQDACAWLLELGLPRMARRAFEVAEESERLAIKKAKVRVFNFYFYVCSRFPLRGRLIDVIDGCASYICQYHIRTWYVLAVVIVAVCCRWCSQSAGSGHYTNRLTT